MQTIPRPLVRTQQATLVAGVLLAFTLQLPGLLAALFGLMLAGLLGGPRYNLIFALARPLWGSRLKQAFPEDAAAQRFNQTIAVSLLGLSLLAFYGLGLPVLGWTLAGLVAAAAGLALTGFCIGCVLYLRLRYWRGRLAGGLR